MTLTNEAATSGEQESRGGESRESVALEGFVRSIQVLAYQDNGGEPHKEGDRFYWQFGSYWGTTDANSNLWVPFKKEFPTGVAALIAQVGRVSWLTPIGWDKLGFTLGPSPKTSAPKLDILVNFMAIGY